MANQVYGYGSSYGGSGLSNVYSSGLGGASAVDPSLLGSSRYDSLGSDPRGYDSLRFSGNGDVGGFGVSGGFGANMIAGGMGAAAVPSYWQPSWPGLDAFSAAALEASGVKRQAEALYHQTLLGTHNAIGQSEALFSSNSLAKRPRYESASSLPIYPQRPGEKDCAYYMRTRICRFGERCKFDHPLWVPEGGIPDWKETPFIETPPERPGEPDCPFFLKTQRCKFGPRCKFNHPKDKIENASAGGDGAEVTSETNCVSVLPERPSEVVCSFYLKTGKCKFGAACKFHHPKDIQISSVEQDPGSGEQNEPSSTKDGENATGDAKLAKTFVPITPALLHNYKGLPIRPGEVDCPFYLKTGSCKYGVACRYNHPDLNAIKPPVAGVFGTMLTSPAVNLPISGINAAAPIFPSIDPRFATSALGVDPTTYPQRPGQMECDFYMKTGKCKFGRMCKYHHPIDRSAPTAMLKQAAQQVVMLTRAGLPRREGVMICPFYMKTGTCSYGPACRFDHPPPGEVMAKATGQGSSGGEENVAAAEQ